MRTTVFVIFATYILSEIIDIEILSRLMDTESSMFSVVHSAVFGIVLGLLLFLKNSIVKKNSLKNEEGVVRTAFAVVIALLSTAIIRTNVLSRFLDSESSLYVFTGGCILSLIFWLMYSLLDFVFRKKV